MQQLSVQGQTMKIGLYMFHDRSRSLGVLKTLMRVILTYGLWSPIRIVLTCSHAHKLKLKTNPLSSMISYHYHYLAINRGRWT